MIENTDAKLGDLRDELKRRRHRRLERRYRWRWIQRRRRRRLLLQLLALERDLREHPDPVTDEVRRAETSRVAAELARNARRLFR